MVNWDTMGAAEYLICNTDLRMTTIACSPSAAKDGSRVISSCEEKCCSKEKKDQHRRETPSEMGKKMTIGIDICEIPTIII